MSRKTPTSSGKIVLRWKYI